MLKIILYLLAVSMIHAKLEIMIEGNEGWARKLPCWRINVFLTKILFGKEISGYHFYLFLLFLLLFHSPFLFVPWSKSFQFFILGCYFWYWILEDFFWFVFNKHYGWSSFKKGKISWHQRWFLGLPLSYWMLGGLGSILLILGGLQ